MLLRLAFWLLLCTCCLFHCTSTARSSDFGPVDADQSCDAAANDIVHLSAIEDSAAANAADAAVNCDCDGWELLSDRTTLTAYYPSRIGDRLDGNLLADMRGRKLHTLQDYLTNRTRSVTVAMDANLRLPYGSRLCMPSLNRHYGRHVRLMVRDTDADLDGQGYGQVDVCVRSEADSYDAHVNAVGVPVFLERRTPRKR